MSNLNIYTIVSKKANHPHADVTIRTNLDEAYVDALDRSNGSHVEWVTLLDTDGALLARYQGKYVEGVIK